MSDHSLDLSLDAGEVGVFCAVGGIGDKRGWGAMGDGRVSCGEPVLLEVQFRARDGGAEGDKECTDGWEEPVSGRD